SGEAGLRQGRERRGERPQSFAGPPADGEDLALLPPAGLLLAPLAARLAGHLRELGHEVAHLADLLLSFFLVGRVDGVLDLSTAGVHRLVLVGRHRFSPGARWSMVGGRLSPRPPAPSPAPPPRW